jgi:aspartate-semialdehyde dehydrogenase
VNPIPVAILGASGSVGQRFVSLLDRHPWFKVVALAGSERTVGTPYREACRWVLAEPMPGWAAETVLAASEPGLGSAGIVFSALPTEEAKRLEPEFAQAGVAVFSNASAHRLEPDVPLLLPEVNAGHAALVSRQRRSRQWTGCIVTNPNCTSTGLTIALKALQDSFGLRRAFAVSLQAISGAGYPGVSAFDITENVIPNIAGEEEKVECEPRKMLGSLGTSGIELASVEISAHTNRVPVIDGHTVCVSVELLEATSPEQAAAAMTSYLGPAEARDLPSAPMPIILLRDEPHRPQPRLDRMTGGGMTTVVGQLRPDRLFHLKFVVLSHNTIRGAAGASIYNAELLVAQGLV